MTEEMKAWIDSSDYETLLKRWRFGSSSDPIFHGEAGSYYWAVMEEKKKQCNHVAASKTVGWDEV